MFERCVLMLTREEFEDLRDAAGECSSANLVRKLEGAPSGDARALLAAAWEGDEAHELCEFLDHLREHWQVPGDVNADLGTAAAPHTPGAPGLWRGARRRMS